MDISSIMGVNFDFHNPGSSPPLSRALQQENIGLVKSLLSRGHNPNVPDNRGCTALHEAACLGEDRGIVFIKPLLKFGAEMNHVTVDGETPLHLACKHQNWKLAIYLLKLGARGNTQSLANLESPLHLAAQGGSETFVLELLKTGCNVNSLSMDSETPLFRAIAESNLSAACILMKNGASTNIRNDRDQTPLASCCKVGNLDLFNSVLKYSKQDLRAHIDSYGSTLLHEALVANNRGIVDRLLGLGASLNLVDDGGTLPLHVAIVKADVSTALKIIELTDKDAVVNSVVSYPRRAKSLMGLACRRNNHLIFEALRSKAYPSVVLSSPVFISGQSHEEFEEYVCGPIAYAAFTNGHLPLNSNSIPELLNTGVPLDPVYEDLGIISSHMGCVEAAITCHSHHARNLSCSCLETIKFILESGGDPDFSTVDCLIPRPYLIAAENNFLDILGLLLQLSTKMDIDYLLLQLMMVKSNGTVNKDLLWAQYLLTYSSGEFQGPLRDRLTISLSTKIPSLKNICRGILRHIVRSKCGKRRNFKVFIHELFPKPIAEFLLYSDLYPSGMTNSSPHFKHEIVAL